MLKMMKIYAVIRYENKTRTTVRLYWNKDDAQDYADELNEVAYRAIYVVRSL